MAAGTGDRLQRQRAEKAAAYARVQADAARSDAAPTLPTASIEQPELNDWQTAERRQTEAAERLLRY
jgi:hypothetical protein